MTTAEIFAIAAETPGAVVVVCARRSKCYTAECKVRNPHIRQFADNLGEECLNHRLWERVKVVEVEQCAVGGWRVKK